MVGEFVARLLRGSVIIRGGPRKSATLAASLNGEWQE